MNLSVFLKETIPTQTYTHVYKQPTITSQAKGLMTKMSIATFFKDEHFLVVEKPEGISSHPSPGDSAPHLLQFLGNEYGVITRLDKQTSGLVLLSSNATFIQNHEITKKEYTALVFGTPATSGTVKIPLTKKQLGSKEKVTQKAHSDFYVLETFPKTTLVKVNIETGRHHQIRKHMRAIGHPIVGDFRHGYNDKNLEFQKLYKKEIRLCLHCSNLEFNYKEKLYQFKSDLPSSFKNIIEFSKIEPTTH